MAGDTVAASVLWAGVSKTIAVRMAEIPRFARLDPLPTPGAPLEAAHWVFNAQDLPTGDKGNVLYEDADGVYTATVTDAVVESGKATFTAEVISSSIGYAHAGDTFTWTVYDNGEGTATGTGDYFTFNGAMLGGLENPGTDPMPYPITSGNIQVHFNG